MALQVLLPLNGTLENQGLCNVAIENINNVLPQNNMGKLYPKSYVWDTDGQAINLKNYINECTFYANYSISAWVYYTTPATNHSAVICSSGNWNQSSNQMCFALYGHNGSGYTTVLVPNNKGWSNGIVADQTILPNKWYHICITYNGQKTQLYINGVRQRNEYNGGYITATPTDTKNLYIGCATYYPGFTLKGMINDFRFYDHCLSLREVQDISIGMVLHYKFDTLQLTNLLPAVDNANYDGGIKDTTVKKYGEYSLRVDATTTQNESFLYTKTGVVYTPGHTYYGRAEIYQTTPQGGCDMYWPEAEPRIIPHNTIKTAKTWTMASAIRTAAAVTSYKGTDFSAGNYKARFDYNNSKTAGSMWFDGLMLIDLTAAFGAGNEPSKEWCDNNIPYFTGTYTKTGYEDSSLQSYANTFNKIPTVGYNSKFYTTNSVLENTYVDTIHSGSITDMSVSCWLRTITFPSGNQVVFADNASKLAFGFYQGKHAIVSCETSVEIFTNINTVWKNAEWNHVVVTKTNDTYALYINNTLMTSRGASNYWTHNKTNSLIIGCRYDGSYATFYNGEINDFRLFASALTAAQVKDLFETPISLSNSQVLFTKELMERSYASSSLTKKGVSKADTLAAFADLHNMPLRLIDDGSVWARVHWIDFSISKTPFTNAEVQECVNADNRFSLMKYIENFKANDGTYEFLLTYPQHATKADKYNRWKQTNSPNAAYGAGTGYETVGSSQPFGTHLAPLTKCSSSGSAVYCTNTTSNWWSPIGQKVLYNSTGIPAADGSTQLEMELWVRVDTIPNNIKLQIFNNCIQSTDFIEW